MDTGKPAANGVPAIHAAGFSLDRFMPKRTVGVSHLRYWSAADLRALPGSVLICKGKDESLAVLVPFALFMDMQKTIFDFEKALAEEAAKSGKGDGR